MKVLLLNRVENIVAKEEISHYDKFLLRLQCFQMSSAVAVPKSVYTLYVGKGYCSLPMTDLFDEGE